MQRKKTLTMRNTEINYTINTIFFNTIQDGALLRGSEGLKVTCNIRFFFSLLIWVKTLTMSEGGRGCGNVSSNDTKLVQAENMTLWRHKRHKKSEIMCFS